VLAGSIFNPIRLPMVSKPKKWTYSTNLTAGSEGSEGSEGTEGREGEIKIESKGGYFLDEFNELSSNNNIIRQNTFNKFDSLISSPQIDSINFLNSRAFEINEDVLKVLINDWENKEDSKLFKSFNALHPKTNELLSQGGNLTSKDKIEIMSHNSKYWNNSNILNIALLMKNQTIYFPTFLDFRGRIYPTPNYLSYQSSDLSRSLLIFKEVTTEKSSNPNYQSILKIILQDEIYKTNIKKGKKLKNNIDYIKLYLSNVYGKSKLSRKGRIRWFDTNINLMIDTYEKNFDSFVDNFVVVSKEPFQFLSIFISYYNHIKLGTEVKTPILFDATCSGIQHLSALTKDIEIANLVNLIQKESPSDFYQYCIDKIKDVIMELTDLELKNKFNQLTITRKWIKQSIMTVPYNVTPLGIADKLADKFDKYYLSHIEYLNLQKGILSLDEILEAASRQNLKNNIKLSKSDIKEIKPIKEKDNLDKIKDKNKNKGSYIYIPHKEIYERNNSFYLTSSELFKFALIVRITVLNIIPPFIKLKKYFDGIINILEALDLPFFWQTPAGMSVSMSSREMISKRVRQSVIKKSKPISILIPTEQIDYKKIKLGLMPNFIHSLDASNIHILITNLLNLNLENINLYTIHDCFASDYNNIAIIELLVKHSFIELYFKKDYLVELHNSFIKQINGYTEIFEEELEKGKLNKFVLINKQDKKGKVEKFNIPTLPGFDWEIDVDKLKEEILYNTYFIS
jgi:DNA-directed RNA polymerase